MASLNQAGIEAQRRETNERLAATAAATDLEVSRRANREAREAERQATLVRVLWVTFHLELWPVR